MNTEKRRERGRPKCPCCGSINVVRICYGLPTEKAREEADQGKIVLGGCCVDPTNPRWHCRDCEEQWGEASNP